MEWARLIVEVVTKLGMVIVEAVSRGDDSVLDAKVGDLLGPELRTTIAKQAADERARRKFGAPPA
jgi:hypothetical protein